MRVPWACSGKPASLKQASKSEGLFKSRRRRTPANDTPAAADQPAAQAEGAAPQAAPAPSPVVVPRLQLAAHNLNGTEGKEPAPETSPAPEAAEESGPIEKDESPRGAAVRCIADCATKLRASAAGAKAYRSNSLALADFADSMVEVVAAGVTLLPASCPSPSGLAQLASLMGNATTLVSSCSSPGWLLLAATPEGCTCDAMQLLHAKMVAVLKEDGLDSLPGVRLVVPDLHDGSRALHRRLRQLGGGSLAAGLEVLAQDEDEQAKLAEALGVATPHVAQDAAHILEAGLLAPEEAAPAAAADDAIATHREDLVAAFSAFSLFGLRGDAAASSTPELDSFRCSKLVREAGLLGPGANGTSLTAQELDVLFATTKGRGARRLPFDGFLRLLALVANKKEVPISEVVAAVVGVHGPALRATTPEAVRFHDDFSGLRARGDMGAAPDGPLDLSRLVDRDAAEKAQRRPTAGGSASVSAATSRRTSTTSQAVPALNLTPRGNVPSTQRTPGTAASTSGAATPRLAGAIGRSCKAGTPAPACSRPTPRGGLTTRDGLTPRCGSLTPRAALTPRAGNLPPPEAALACEDTPECRNLRLKFSMFAQFGRTAAANTGGELLMDSAQFAKVCRDAQLLGKGLDSIRVDLVFQKAITKGARRMSFPQFLGCLPRLAEARGCAEAEVVRRLVACEGPTRHGTTTPEAVRLSDRSTFSGIAARGGPSTVENRVTLEQLCDRSGRRTSLLAPVV